MKTTHKHVLATAIVAAVACLWGFVIYPKLALGLNSTEIEVATPGDGEVTLSWADPNGREPSVEIITGYRIYYFDKTKEDTKWVVDTNSLDLFYTVTGLTNDLEYTFEITVLSDEIESARSRPVTATPTSRQKGGEDRIVLEAEPFATATSNSVTITWNTSVPGTSVVEYGPTSDFKGQASFGAQKTINHSIEITGLTACAGYWYKVISYDDDSNLAESQDGEFKTGGCKGESSILTYQVGKVTTSTGRTVTVTNSGQSIQVVVPANLKSGRDEVAIEAIKLEKDLVQSEISTPTSKQWIGNAYSLKAFQDEKTELTDTFDVPVEVTMSYTAEDVTEIDPSTLKIYHYEDATGWQQLSNCSVDQSARTVTCETTSFSIFGLFGGEQSSGGQVTSSGTYPKPTPIENVPTVIKPENNLVPTELNPSIKNNFQKNLGLGLKDLDVKNLQALLNKLGFIVAVSGPGSLGNETDYFGPLTFQALIKFQEVYKAQILTPLGLSKGTGFFGEKTRAFINSMQ